MVFDPRPGAASALAQAMLRELGCSSADSPRRLAGHHWAAAAVPPPAGESTAGAHILQTQAGTLIWTGEIFLPEEWTADAGQPLSCERISRTLLNRLTEHGIEELANIDGAFCGAWYDPRYQRWSVFNDRFGLLPVFYARARDRLVVAPRAWLAWLASGMPLRLSDRGAIDLIRAQNAVEDHTLIKGVHWLIGGHALIREPHQISCRKYWEFRHLPEARASMEERIDAYVEACRPSVARCSAAAAPLMLGISGGMDSRMILAMCHELGRTPACYTAGWAYSDDVRFGRSLATTAGANHEWLPLTAQGLPERLERMIVDTDGLHGAAHMLMASPIPDYLAAHEGSVLLEGLVYPVAGGGCIPDDDDLPTPQRPPHRCSWAVSNLHSGGPIEWINELLHDHVARESDEWWRQYIDDRFRHAPGEDPIRKAEYTTQSGRPGRNNVLGVTVQRGHVLIRHPLCDRRVQHWVATTPPALRRGKSIYMEIIRRRFPRFARVQRTNYNGLPLTRNRLRRQICWQKEKLHRWWTRRHHADARRYGMDGAAVRAWGFDAWRTSGAMDVLLESNARVLRWVRPDRLLALWSRAVVDPTTAVPILTLATLETMIRRLESWRSISVPEALEPAITNDFVAQSLEMERCASC